MISSQHTQCKAIGGISSETAIQFSIETYSILNFEKTPSMLDSGVYLHKLNIYSTLDYSFKDDTIVKIRLYCWIISVFKFTLMIDENLI